MIEAEKQEILKLTRERLRELDPSHLIHHENEQVKKAFEFGNMVGRNQTQRILTDVLYSVKGAW